MNFGNVGNLWCCWMNFGLDFGGIEIVKKLLYGFRWIHSWYMREILLACVKFISWTWQNFVGMSMEEFCEHRKILWVWGFVYGSINVGSWKIFVVILSMEIFLVMILVVENFLVMILSMEKFFRHVILVVEKKKFPCWAWKILRWWFWLWKYFCWVCEFWHGEFLLAVGLYFCWSDFLFLFFLFLFWYGMEFLTSWWWAKLCFA